MPQYKYLGRDQSGRNKNGKLFSTSKREATLKLKQKGIRVEEIQEIPETLLNKELSFGSRVKLHDFVIYLRQFATLLKAGVTVVDSTRILANQTQSKTLQRALISIEEDLRNGNPLSEATLKHKNLFPIMFINMVRAGEIAGNLDETLDRLATYFEKQHRTRQKIKGALAYPAVITVVAIAVVIFLLVAVVPTFVDMFKDFGAQLPAITVFVLNSSEFMQRFWWLIVLLLLLFVGVLFVLYKDSKTRYYLDLILLKMPVFGPIVQKAAIARMTRTLGSLFSSSVPILRALTIVETIVGNEILARVLKQSRDSLEEGLPLTMPMENHWAIPPLVSHMIAIGEQTGSLDAMLTKVADFYESEVEIATDRLKSLIEPIMILVLASVVGTIVISIMVPMFDIYNHVQ
ncbi:type II secretion system F family protein [Priestia koreensis]|uniref:type II secretion system F family protein n=1 Tax=Priestia koreensis TaxID=284581 RepID=UPI00345B29F0